MSEATADPVARYRNVLYEALAGDAAAVSDADPLIELARLIANARSVSRDESRAMGALDRLAAVAREASLQAALEVAEARFDTPADFNDAIYLARGLVRDTDATMFLLETRGYLEDARVPTELADLSTDRAAVLDATTFVELWRDQARLDWMLNTASIWRRDYVATYAAQHAAHQAAVASIAESIDALSLQASAMRKLNGLTRLGAPLAVEALKQLDELERLFPCPLTGAALAEALAQSSVCPECSFRLGDEAPVVEARRIQTAIERGLAGQQARLAQRVVTRLLAQPVDGAEARVERFIQVVQASDLSGLALVLDDALVDFLRYLLDVEDAETQILTRLQRAFPEITQANLDAAVAEFRAILETELGRSSGRLRLAPEE